MKIRDFIKELLDRTQLDDTIRWYDASDGKYKNISFWRDGKTVEFILENKSEASLNDFWEEEE